MAQKYYITTAITYTSGKPHIGNTYEIVLADMLARFKRRQGFDVFFQTGTDEHGEKIENKASAAGKTPKEFVDGVAAEIKGIWDLMNVSYDNFIRTTDPSHEEQVQKIFKKLYDRGDIYKGAYKGWYCTPCESFWTESQLSDGKCPDCGREVKLAEEEAYFFRMSKYADKLMAYYDAHPDFILPYSRKNEMVNNFLKPGLQDLCVSRTSFKWGIPVSFDEGHVVYVWLDALTNYITGLGYDCDGASSKAYKKFWPADVHVIGKDIVRFHTIYWPIFLMALGEELPQSIFGHPWLLQDGGKMSKSKGNVIYADDLAEVFGVDAVRYYLLSQIPYDNDGLISWELMAETVNSDLANVYGNLVNRTVAMVNRYFGGILTNPKATEPIDKELADIATGAKAKVEAKLEEYRTADALAEIFAVFRRANKYIDETEPWVLARDDAKSDRLKTVLYNLTECIVIGTELLRPFMPALIEKVIAECGASERAYNDLDKFGLLADGTKVAPEPEILFKRADLKEVIAKAAEIAERYTDKVSAGPKITEAKTCDSDKPEVKAAGNKSETKADGGIVAASKEEVCAQIGIDDFVKVELKVGKILTAEKVEKADKLLKFTVQVGEEIRTIVSGIAKYYSPEETVGKRVVVVSNLKPAKLRGIESQGMLLCAVEGDKVVLVSPEKEVESGSPVR